MSMRQSRDELIKRGVLKEIFEKGELKVAANFGSPAFYGATDVHDTLKRRAPDLAHLEI